MVVKKVYKIQNVRFAGYSSRQRRIALIRYLLIIQLHKVFGRQIPDNIQLRRAIIKGQTPKFLFYHESNFNFLLTITSFWFSILFL